MTNGDRASDSAAPSSSFFRNVLKLAGGTALGQGVVILCSPVLSRIYAPSEFGAFGVFSAAILILNALDSMRYEMAIPLPRRKRSAENLLALCATLVLITSALTGLICLGWGDQLCYAAKVPQLAPFLWVLPISLTAAGMMEALNYLAVRNKEFDRIAKARVSQNVCQTAVQLGLGLWPGGAISLLLGDAVGRMLGVLVLFRGGWLRDWVCNIRLNGMRHAAWSYRRFPRYMAGATFLNIAALQMPFLIIPYYFGTELAGNYFLAYRMLVIPTGLIGGAVAQIFLGEAAASISDPDRLQYLSRRLFLALTSAYLPLYLVIALSAPVLFQLVFGAKWQFAGGFVQVLAPMALIWGIASPLSSVLIVRNRLGESLLFTVLELVAKVGALYIGVKTGSFHLAVMLISIVGVVLSCLAAWRFLRAAQVTIKTLLFPLLWILLSALPSVIITRLVLWRLYPWWALLISGAGLVGTYGWMFLRWRRGEGP